MHFEPVVSIPRLHGTPLATIHIDMPLAHVDLDDIAERRLRLTFTTYQAIRITTFDCFGTPGALHIVPQTVVEVRGSEWISELTKSLRQCDEDADFMQYAKHYLIPTQVDFVEIVSHEISWQYIDKNHT